MEGGREAFLHRGASHCDHGSLRRANSEVLETSSIALGLQRTLRICRSAGLVHRMSSSLIKVGWWKDFNASVKHPTNKMNNLLITVGWRCGQRFNKLGEELVDQGRWEERSQRARTSGRQGEELVEQC